MFHRIALLSMIVTEWPSSHLPISIFLKCDFSYKCHVQHLTRLTFAESVRWSLLQLNHFYEQRLVTAIRLISTSSPE